MIRLGWRMTLRTGREALIRLAVTMAAVGIGVALLLNVLALYHGYTDTIGRPCWTCTGQDQFGPPPPGQTDPAPESDATPATTPADDAELWNYREDFYQGRIIERADVAVLGARAPVVPGLSRMPGAGEYVASPALAKLIATAPRAELGDRFPGTLVGTIGQRALSGPADLVIVIGHTPAELAAAPGTSRITAIQTTPKSHGTDGIYNFGFAIGAVALLLPMLILVGNATRLAAARREERYAAMRLVGATTRQIGVIASVDAVIGAVLGSAFGVGLYALLRPLTLRVSITGDRFFSSYVAPTLAGYLAVLVGVPVAAAVASLLSLRRVGISPLGVSRKTTPAPPRAWRVIPLLVGLVLFIVPLALRGTKAPNGGIAALSLILIMFGLMIGGTWLTMQASRVLARFANGPSSLLAARRMADNPRAVFRSVSGLVLAVFVGTFIAGAVPAALAAQQTPSNTALNNVLRVPLGGPTGGALPQAGAALINHLRSLPGVSVLPLYDGPPIQVTSDFAPPSTVVTCASLAQMPALGRCAPGTVAVVADVNNLLFTDNVAVLNGELPLVDRHSTRATEDPATLKVNGVLVKVDSAATLEQVRTLLTVQYRDLTVDGPDAAPQTFGEVAKVRAALYIELGQVVLLIMGATLLVAGCSLAIAMGGGMVERKRPFTLLRVSGTATNVLRRVVLLESVLPLVSATVVAAITGMAVAIPVDAALSPNGTAPAMQLPGLSYYTTMGIGLIVSLAVIVVTLPLLNRMTMPDTARFE